MNDAGEIGIILVIAITIISLVMIFLWILFRLYIINKQIGKYDGEIKKETQERIKKGCKN